MSSPNDGTSILRIKWEHRNSGLVFPNSAEIEVDMAHERVRASVFTRNGDEIEIPWMPKHRAYFVLAALGVSIEREPGQ